MIGVRIVPGIAIAGELARLPFGAPVDVTLQALAARNPTQWTWSGTLPPSWSVTATGTKLAVRGVAAPPGSYSLNVTAVDARGYMTSRSYAIEVIADGLELVGTLAAGQQGVAYAGTLYVAGGTAPYTIQRISAPAWMTFAVAGDGTVTVTGTPTAHHTGNVTLQVTDATSATDQLVTALEVDYPGVTLSGSYPSAVQGQAYSHDVTIIGGDGSYSTPEVIAGALPAGLSLSVAGSALRLSGTPTATGAASFTVKVDDGLGHQAQAAYSVETYAPLGFNLSIPDLTVGVYFVAGDFITGGNGSYSNARVTSGSLPAGMSFQGFLNGILYGTPTAAQTVSFTLAIDSGDGQTAYYSDTVTVSYPDLTLAGNYPDGKVGTAYGHNLAIAGGDGTYSSARVTSGSLPAGLSLSISGGTNLRLSGTPTTAHTRSFTVAVDSGDGQTASSAQSVTVAAAYATLTLTGSYPDGTKGTPYSSTIDIDGGDGAYSNPQVTSGSLPAGLSLSIVSGSKLQIAGTPTGAGNASFTVSVDSGDGQTATHSDTIDVAYASLTLTGDYPGGKVGQSYSQDLSISGGDGSYSNPRVTTGSLPSGLSLSIVASSLRLSGTPSTAQTCSFTVAVDSGDGQTAASSDSVVISYATLALSGSFPDATVNQSYSHELSISGGSGSYSNPHIVGIYLPPSGLSLSLVGSKLRLSGTPTLKQTRTFTVAVDSSDGQTATHEDTVAVSWPDLTLSGSYADGTKGEAYSDELAIAGGDGDYSDAQVASGSLPDGLSLSLGNTLRISGTPTTAQSKSFTVSVKSGDGQTATHYDTITIGYPDLTLSGSFPNGPSGLSYTASMTIAGGDGSYSNPRVTSGLLPTGLSLSISGTKLMLTGTPTIPQTRSFTVAVDSGDGQTATRSDSVTIT